MAFSLNTQYLSAEPTSINVGLWEHRFQFAGYYAAIEKGYYAEQGLQVNLVKGSPRHDVINEVLSGQLEFGVANGELVLQRLKGKPLVAIAATFQHSPSVLITLKSSNIQKPKDLQGKRIMTLNGQMPPSYISMLSSIDKDIISSIKVVKSSLDVQDLIDGKVDAFHAYVHNEPYLLDKLNIDYNILNPSDYGIDFYSDFLFTRDSLIQENSQLIDKFRKATLQGWHYSMDNPEEIIQIIQSKYNSNKTLDELRYEALAISSLVRSELVDIGYINENRIQKMAKILIQEKFADDLYHLDGLVYRAENEQIANANNKVFWLSLVLISLVGLCATLIIVLRRLKQEIANRKEIEEQLRHLASVDPLTNLYNRRMFANLMEKETNKARRKQIPYSLVILDIDYFKSVNDQYGHHTGDKVILGIADTIRMVARSCDVCARFGGEEFIILLPETKLFGASSFTSRLQEKINRQLFYSEYNETFQVTCSFGIVEWNLATGLDELISKADRALYNAKRSGRNKVCRHLDTQAAE